MNPLEGPTVPTKPEYLAAKRSVDERALNRRVRDRFLSELADRHRGTDRGTVDDPVRIVEVGAGIGAMVHRLAQWGSLPSSVTYRGVDVDERCIAAARDRVPAWLAAEGYDVDRRDGTVVARADGGPNRDERRLAVSFEVADAFSIVDDADAVIAAAFLDLVDLERALGHLRDLLRDGGLLYAPITFDGGTTFGPAHPLDDRIERLYHHHMDEIREQPGSSTAGRELLESTSRAGADDASDAAFEVLAAGSADWVIRPRNGGYPADERTVLAFVLETIADALVDYPPGTLEPAALEQWLETRRSQLADDRLGLVVHHLDVVARRCE